VVLRPQYVYGPGQRTTFLIPHVITALLDGRHPQLSTGERMLDCVYAEDVAHAFVAAAEVPGVEGNTIDIGSGAMTSVRRIVELIVEYVGAGAGRPVFGALPQRPLEQLVETDVNETARVLGWRAGTGLEQGLRRTVEWYRSQVELRTSPTAGGAARRIH
jgi:UDP-glucose 4-epimerase